MTVADDDVDIRLASEGFQHHRQAGILELHAHLGRTSELPDSLTLTLYHQIIAGSDLLDRLLPRDIRQTQGDARLLCIVADNIHI